MRLILTFILTFFLLLLQAQEKETDELFSFEPDERLFTVYALMNGAGFHFDFFEPDKIRIEVNEYLDSVLTTDMRTEIKNFYYSHGYENDSSVHFWHYTTYALWLTEPPEFKVVCDSGHWILKEWAGFDTIIAKFYDEAKIGVLFQYYREKLRQMNLVYKPYADSAFKCITSFCKLPPDYYRKIANKIYFNLNPLMSHWTAQTVLANRKLYIINGLGKETDIPSIEAFLHEPLHHVVNPIVDSNKILLKNTEELYIFSLENGFKKLYAYPEWRFIVIDGYVRFLTHYINYKYNTNNLTLLEENIHKDYKAGFILQYYIYEHIKEFEKSEMSFSDFYIFLMKNIDFEREKKRMIDLKMEKVK